jgi:hypothetical protein
MYNCVVYSSNIFRKCSSPPGIFEWHMAAGTALHSERKHVISMIFGRPPCVCSKNIQNLILWVSFLGSYVVHTACVLSFRPLALPPSSGIDPEVVCRLASPLPRKLEHAGKAYQDLLRLRVTGSNSTGHEKAAAVPQRRLTGEEQESENIRNKARRTFVGDDDYYELLELGDMRWRATEEDVKKAYRKVSLR